MENSIYNSSQRYKQQRQQLPHISQPFPKDYLILSIFNIACCNICFEILAIRFSLKTRESIRNNNLENAQKQSLTALKLNIAGILFGSIIIFLTIILIRNYLKNIAVS
jgi:hypothetical protein